MTKLRRIVAATAMVASPVLFLIVETAGRRVAP